MNWTGKGILMMTMHNLHSSMHGVVWNEVVMSAKCCLAAAENQIALGNVAEEMYNVAVRKRNLFWGRKGKSCLVGQTLYSAPICNKARHFFVKFSKFQESTVTVHLLTRSHTSQSSRRHQSFFCRQLQKPTDRRVQKTRPRFVESEP